MDFLKTGLVLKLIYGCFQIMLQFLKSVITDFFYEYLLIYMYVFGLKDIDETV